MAIIDPQNENPPTGVLYVPLGTNVSVGCTVTGSGIQPGTEVTTLASHVDGYLVITLNQLPWIGNTVPDGVTSHGSSSISELTGLTGETVSKKFDAQKHDPDGHRLYKNLGNPQVQGKIINRGLSLANLDLDLDIAKIDPEYL